MALLKQATNTMITVEAEGDEAGVSDGKIMTSRSEIETLPSIFAQIGP